MLDSEVRRPLVLAAIMAAMFMIAIEVTIVSTAMPRIVAQLGGLNLYAWVFSSFLLAQTATTIVFGKLSDLYGRKPILLVGIVTFLLGSVLCGLASSMAWLIAFRLVQGLGAGAIQPVALTLVGDLYPGAERGRVQGWLASVWGVSSLLGPLAGGLIVERWSWAWVFWINVPVGIVAAIGFQLFLRERVAHEERSVDVSGASLFTIAVAALMLALTGTSRTASLAALGVLAVSGALFVAQERRARDPMIAGGLWFRRTLATINAATLFSGMALIGLTTFLPMYVQAVMGRSALEAGFALTASVLGWPIAATIGARQLHRFGAGPILIAGAMLMPIGAAVFPLLQPGSSPWLAGAGSLVMGFGMGFFSVASIIIVQGGVGWAERGTATSATIFARNLGSTLGAAAFGGILNLRLHAWGTSVSPADIRRLLDRAGSVVPLAERQAMGSGLHAVFWGVMGTAMLVLIMTAFVPRGSGKAPPA